MRPEALPLLGILLAGVSLADDSLNCFVGPIQLELGGAPWQVSSCEDGRSLVFAAMEDNPAMPFYFLVYRGDEVIHIIGEGQGSKEHSAAACAELEKMTAMRLDELVEATKDAKATQ